jgi:hypothetical protein
MTWFDSTSKELAEINRMLAAKKLETLTVMSRDDWDKKDGGTIGATTKNELRAMMGRTMMF